MDIVADRAASNDDVDEYIFLSFFPDFEAAAMLVDNAFAVSVTPAAMNCRCLIS